MFCWPMIFREPFPTTPALKAGDGPCKHCNPEPIEHKTIAFPVLPKKPQASQERSLSKDEQSAIGRFNRAKQEREAAFKRGSLSDAEKSNIMALSQPGLAFWASRGYRTFHRRNCPQITGSTSWSAFLVIRTLSVPATAHAGIVSQVRSKMSSIHDPYHQQKACGRKCRNIGATLYGTLSAVSPRQSIFRDADDGGQVEN